MADPSAGQVVGQGINAATPLLQGLITGPAGQDLVNAFNNAGDQTGKQQMMMQMLYQNLLQNQMAAFTPSQNALAQVYGGTPSSSTPGNNTLPGFSYGLSSMGNGLAAPGQASGPNQQPSQFTPQLNAAVAQQLGYPNGGLGTLMPNK